jgi:outer membrane protein OmpA-like peptidoglycan-associated protein/opacity protein-like surface antigen
MQFLRITILTLIPVMFWYGTQAQAWYLGFGPGASQYTGDIPDRSGQALFRGTATGGLHYHNGKRFHFSLTGTVTELRAMDANTDALKSRGLSFTSRLAEGALMGRYDLLSRDNGRFRGYVTAGAALFYVNPWTFGPSGEKVSLYPLSTGGQGLSQYSGVKDHQKVNGAIPFGAGLDFALMKRIRLEFDFILRKTFTDYIDDIGSIYPDRNVLLNARGAAAVAYAWRGTGAYPAAGSARGDSENMDMYSSFNVRLKLPLTKEDQKQPAPKPIPAKTAPVVAPMKDSDGDSIPDAQDMCPQVPGVARRGGCPVPDSDLDGLNDEVDKCPEKAGPVRNDGCPITDRDKDGVEDAMDRCPDLAGVTRYFGCPIPDTDRDGVNDEDDRCPKEPGSPLMNGCPMPDRDKDGVVDSVDACPTIKGIIKENGCPSMPISTVKVEFTPGTGTLTTVGKMELDKLARWLTADHPSLRIEIESHTDNVRRPEASMTLSYDRAVAIYGYLAGKKVALGRMQANGLGDTQPVADNATPQGRARNNRIVFRLRE